MEQHESSARIVPADALWSTRGASAWLAAAASLALAIGFGGYAAQLRGRVTVLESRLREATLRAVSSEQKMTDAHRAAF